MATAKKAAPVKKPAAKPAAKKAEASGNSMEKAEGAATDNFTIKNNTNIS